MTDPPRGVSRWRGSAADWTGRRAAVACGLLYLPFVGFGYGTDIDITNVLRSGESLLDGSYRYSRPPGALPYEALVGVLDRLGGPAAVNLASALAAVTVLWHLAALLEDAPAPGRGSTRNSLTPGVVAVAIVGTQPWFWIAATSLGDYAFALAALLAGVRAERRGRPLAAGVAFGTAVGFRSSTAVLVAAVLLAAALGDDEPTAATGEPHRGRDAWSRVRRLVPVAATTGVVATLWFVPPWLSVGRTTRFLVNEFSTSTLWVQLARWGIKNVAFFGVVTLVLLAVRASVLADAARRFRDDHLVRVALLAAVAAELVFLRFPWKPVHLLPVLVAVAVLVARSGRASDGFAVSLVAANLLLAVVSVTIAEPDVADAATTGRLRVGLTRGVVVNDLDCRTDPAFAEWPDLDDPAADFAAVGAFACQARSWRAGAGPEASAP